MVEAIKAETNGRVAIEIFPNGQLGGATDVLGQPRSGNVEFFTLAGNMMSTLVPAAALNSVGFAFNDYDPAWKAISVA